MSGFPGEQTYTSKKTVKYLLQKTETNSSCLLIIFSSFPNAGQSPFSNYFRILSKVNAHKLFIVDDFGPEASYYLAENRDFSIEETVLELIEHICFELEVGRKDITAIGIGMGGFAALYYGVKYGFGNVIAGAPHTAVGDYVFNNHPVTAKYIAGGLSGEDRVYLNMILPNALRDSTDIPTIHLHVGRGDHHYNEHVLPFVKLLDEHNAHYVLDVNGYQNHSEVGIHFPDFLLCNLDYIVKKSSEC